MKTSKPISTISYNTQKYLALKLNELLKAGKISKWYFIPHKPEDDEAGNKPHFHVYVEPAKMVQTDDLREFLKEPDPEKPTLPKGCISWRRSAFGSWYLYGLHDKAYLASKGEKRRFHYADKDFLVSDEQDFLFDVRTVDVIGELGAFKGMQDAISNGLTFTQFLRSGRVPIPQVRQYVEVWQLLSGEDETYRGDHKPHNVDPETGELIDHQ